MMKSKLRQQNSLYRRLVLSYSLIIVALVLTIITAYLLLFYNSVKNEEHERAEIALAQLSQNAEDNIFTLADSFVVNYILKNSDVLKYFNTPNEMQTLNHMAVVHNQINQYLFTSNLYHSIYLYNIEGANIISTNGAYILDSSMNRKDVNWLLHGSFPRQRQWLVMNDFLTHHGLPENFRQNVVSLVVKYPAGARDGAYRGFVTVNLSTDEIYSVLDIDVSNSDDMFVVFSPDFTPLRSHDTYAFQEEVEGELADKIMAEEDEFFIQLGDQGYDALTLKGESGFSYVHLRARSTVLQKLVPVLSIAVIIAVIAIIGPVLISMLLTSRIYLPIKLLTNRSIEVSKSFGREAERTEMAISSALDLLTQRVITLQNEIAAFGPERKNALLRGIFGLSGPNGERISRHLDQLGLSFPYGTFACIYVTLKNEQDIDRAVFHTTLYNLCYFIENIHFEGCVRLATNAIGDGAAILINFEDPETDEKLMSVLRQYFASQCQHEPLFGVSKHCRLIDSLPACYEGAKQSVRYHFLMPNQDSFKQLDAEEWDSRSVVLDIAQYVQLERAMKSADFSAAKASLDGIFTSLTQRVYCLESVMGEITLLYKLLSDKYQVFDAVECDTEKAELMRDARNIDQAMAALTEGCGRYCNARQEQMSGRLMEDIERIKAYIVKRVEEYDVDGLTLSAIAESFGRNPNYLSSVFPKYAGINFRDYVTEVKLEKAARELKRPGAMIYCVANSLGYYNVSYFIRIFKAKYGCTPGQFYEKTIKERGNAL
ncbi:MAG: helix-turn-helix domain-containing protein [Christensenellales bacterium]|jgi:two-component system response regulator YesN